MVRLWWLNPLYWIISFAPLAAAFWVFLNLPDFVEVTPNFLIPTNRIGVWVMPSLNALVAVAVSRRRKNTQAAPLAARVFLMSILSAFCLVLVWAHYTGAPVRAVIALFGRVFAIITGGGVSLLALQIRHAPADSAFAKILPYTEKSQPVWMKTQVFAARTLYLAGIVAMSAGFFTTGLSAAILALFAIDGVCIAIWLYAKRLYEDTFR